ncbi:MAG TPA: hypothetical protein VEC02_00910, partial [Nitrososphaerales archaeon]|nr:hypothetical protein [Nitrososphaerales archaeon]
MNAYATLAIMVVVLIVGAGTGYLVGIANQRATAVVSASTPPATLSTAYVFKSRIFAMDVNGTLFYADDVSNDTHVENPG